MKLKIKKPQPVPTHRGADILPRYGTMATYRSRIIAKKNRGSQTPGSAKRADTCQLSAVGGLPRKAFMRSRSYKLGAAYTAWCTFADKVNK